MSAGCSLPGVHLHRGYEETTKSPYWLICITQPDLELVCRPLAIEHREVRFARQDLDELAQALVALPS